MDAAALGARTGEPTGGRQGAGDSRLPRSRGARARAAPALRRSWGGGSSAHTSKGRGGGRRCGASGGINRCPTGRSVRNSTPDIATRQKMERGRRAHPPGRGPAAPEPQRPPPEGDRAASSLQSPRLVPGSVSLQLQSKFNLQLIDERETIVWDTTVSSNKSTNVKYAGTTVRKPRLVAPRCLAVDVAAPPRRPASHTEPHATVHSRSSPTRATRGASSTLTRAATPQTGRRTPPSPLASARPQPLAW